MKAPKPPRIPSWETTPPDRYFSRREIMAGLAGAAALAIGPTAVGEATRLRHSQNARFSVSDPPNSREDIATYNNVYEFGADKADPAILGVTHFWWQVKADRREPAVYAVLLAGLLAWRVRRARHRTVSSRTVLASR
jgi:hypothetical protein